MGIEYIMMNDKTIKQENSIIKPVLLIILIITSLTLINFSPVGEYFKPSKLHLLQERFSQLHSLAPIVFVTVSSVLISIGVPRSSISIFGGMVFGFIAGTLLSVFSALVGSVITFYLVRYLGRPYFFSKYGEKVKYLEEKIKQNGFLVVVLLRQSPLTCMLVNILIGLSPIKAKTFVIASFVGFLPEAVIFNLFGSSVRENFVLRVLVATVFLIVLIIFVQYVYKKSKLASEIKYYIKNIRKKKEYK